MGISNFVSNREGGVLQFIVRSIVRFFQFVFALTVVGLYGVRVNDERVAHAAESPQWVYAVVIASISALTTVIYALPKVPSAIFFAWDSLLL